MAQLGFPLRILETSRWTAAICASILGLATVLSIVMILAYYVLGVDGILLAFLLSFLLSCIVSSGLLGMFLF